jgi:dolichyl-phosphate-mannose--protein O-mannosyl transferase
MPRHQDVSLLNEFVWVIAAAVLGFATTVLFSGLLELRRNWFVAIYALVVGSFLYGYIRWSGVDLRLFLLHRWIWGVIGTVVVGAIMVASVQRMPASAGSSGLALM